MTSEEKVALAIKDNIEHIEGRCFSLPPLESHTDGELDIRAGDKFAANAIWEDDAADEHMVKYKVLHDWIAANCPRAEFKIAWLDGWDCLILEDEPWADEELLYGMPYHVELADDAQVELFKKTWCLEDEVLP
jgi:hypothetical protein